MNRKLTLLIVVALLASFAVVGAPAVAQDGSDPGTFKLNPDVSGEVELWHFWASPVRRTAIRRVVAICSEKLPNITVTDVVKPFGDIWTANIAAVSAGSGMPDVIVSDRPKLPNDAAEGIYQNLQEFATRDGVTGEAFWPFTWEQSLYEGNTYGLPYETDVRVLYWNKNLFRAAGLDPEKPPTTWAELQEYADKLDVKGADGKFERIAFFPLVGNVGPEIWAETNGVNLYNEEGNPQINSSGMAETLNWIKGWIDRYGGWNAWQEFRGSFGAPPNDAFMSGRVAMLVDIAGYTSQLNFYRPQVRIGENNERVEWGVGLIPYGKNPSSYSGGFAMSIPTGADAVDAAWEFIKCATSEEAQVSWARDTYSIPGNQLAADDAVLMADPAWAFFLEAMKTSNGGRFVPAYANWGEQLGQRFERFWTGELPIEQGLQEAQEAIDKTIAERR